MTWSLRHTVSAARLLWLAAFVGAAPASASEFVGTRLPSPPSAPPGRVAPTPADPLAAAIDRRTQGDLRAAAWYYEQWLARKGGTARTRSAVQLALGLVYLDLSEPNLASALFSRVRASATPVQPWGAWYEALADHRRGRHESAARECSAYRKNWPDGDHADECLVLIGDALVAAGQRGGAIGAYRQYLDLHPDSPREETLNLGIALAVTNTDPLQGIPLLQRLSLDHAYHSTGDTAQRKLDELATKGFVTALPDDALTSCRIAAERKRCGFESDAWKRFEALQGRAIDDPVIAAWIEAHEDTFRWGTKQYETIATMLAEEYKTNPAAELAWQRYRALGRAGQWKQAVEQFEAGKKAHGGSGRFSGREELGKAQLLAGNYEGAVATWSALGKTGGSVGRHARWLAGFAAFRAGDYPGALARLDAVILARGDEELAARWYRSRTLEGLGRHAEAEVERQKILDEAPWNWYAALVRSRSLAPGVPGAPGAPGVPGVPGVPPALPRAGRWVGPTVPTLPAVQRVGTGGAALAWPDVGEHAAANAIGWAALAWNAPPPSSPLPTVTQAPPLPRDEARPDSYRPTFLYDPAAADKILGELAEEHADLFKWAAAAADLARAGAYDLSAPLVARMYDSIDPAVGGVAHPEVDLSVAEWRQIFLFARDDYHVARFSWGSTKLASNEEERRDAQRMTYPTAHIDALYRHGQTTDVDPLLALGIMRQESVYRQWALSPTGAIGLMQVMPRTGSKVAALMGDASYSPEVLEDPSTNVRYGVWYLSRLMERFGGAWPLAVASYNGGPHNVSAWLRPWGDTIRMDDFVEQIPFGETRDYVKKVTGWYSAYVELYTDPGSTVFVPDRIRKDDAGVIDF